jgi:hypothetical protein
VGEAALAKAVIRTQFSLMSTAEILAELPKLSPAERAQVQNKLEELATFSPDGWRDDSGLSDAEKRLIESRIAEHERNPGTALSWAVAEDHLKARYGE